jgi:Cu(I)/Ag(I) efflux system membrane protein CusA/SilA
MKVVEAVRAGNNDVGGRLIESSGTEYMVRGRGYAKSVDDLRRIVLATTASGTPVRVQDIGDVTLGPDLRRGVADWNGEGDTVAGIIVIRQGENALAVIDRVKAKLKEIEPGLPAGVQIVTAYDRSDLILRSIENLKGTLIEEMAIVALIIFLFLWHIPSALIPVITIPVAIVIGFVPMRAMGLSSNIMSLGGIAIAIGAMVDASIVVVEQTHKKLEEWERTGRKADYHRVVIDAVKEVGGPSFFALLVIAVSFLPVLTLEAQEGRLFKPLAYTKTISMIVASVLAITLDPAMRLLFTRMRNYEFRPRFLAHVVNAVLVGKIHSEEKHPISRILIHIYEPVCAWALRWKWAVIVGAIAVVAGTIPVYLRLGSEFMPPLDEGTLLYMPSTLPGISLTQAQDLMQLQDRILRSFPEVESVLGKAGRAETSTDPAPLSMMETVVVLKPRDQWRSVPTWYTDRAPVWALPALRRITSDRLSTDQLIEKMNQALTIPGTSNAWTMPVKGRIDMLTTGVRTPVGVKIYGSDIQVIEKLGAEIEQVLPAVSGTRNVFAERTAGGYFLDFDWNREALGRYGLSIDEAQTIVMNAVGGENVTTTVEGRERYPVNVRYMRDFRSDPAQLSRILVPVNLPGSNAQIPISELATLRMRSGPGMIRDENGLLSGYVYVDVAGRDIGGYVAEAKKTVRDNIKLPPGYAIAWSGQYEAMERVRERLVIVIPLTLFLILMLLDMNTRSLAKTAIIVLAVPFSAVGAIWFLYALGYNMSIGVWVGLIALMGVDAETGVFMLLYLDLAYKRAREEGRLQSLADLQAAIRDGAVKRIRPKFMTVACMFLGLVPILWSTGAGADVMKRIAAPMVGGIFTSFLLELLVYPAVYEVWKWHFELKRQLSS